MESDVVEILKRTLTLIIAAFHSSGKELSDEEVIFVARLDREISCYSECKPMHHFAGSWSLNVSRRSPGSSRRFEINFLGKAYSMFINLLDFMWKLADLRQYHACSGSSSIKGFFTAEESC